MTRFAIQPRGTAYQTMATPILWARVIERLTLINKLIILEKVKTLTSPSPLKIPSTQCLDPTNTKKNPMKAR